MHGNQIGIRRRNRKFPLSNPNRTVQATKEDIARLITLGATQKSTSSYDCPASPILKLNGDNRLMVNYRPVNEVTVKDAHPRPDMWNEPLSIPKSNTFRHLDLKTDYHRVKMHSNCVKITVFAIPLDNINILMYPLDLPVRPEYHSNQRGHFYNIMNALRFFRWHSNFLTITTRTSRAYVWGPKILSENNVVIGFEETEFFQTSVNYLGQTIDSNCMRSDHTRLPPDIEFEHPRNAKQPRKLLGHIIGPTTREKFEYKVNKRYNIFENKMHPFCGHLKT